MYVYISLFLKMKNTKKIILFVVICVILIVGLIFSIFKIANNTKENTSKKNGKVVATSKFGDVNEQDIINYLDSLEKTFGQKVDFYSLKNEEKELVINEIINNRIILNKAKKSGVQNNKNYKIQIKEVEDNLLKETYLQDLIKKNVDEKSIKQRYDEVNEILKNKKEYKVKHIVVSTEDDIKKVINELKHYTFEEVAEKYSIDGSKTNGGDLGYVIEGQTVKEFDEVLQKQPKNKLSEPFKTQFGWHVLIKEDERNAVIPDYEQTKNTVRDALIRDFMRQYGLDNIKEANIKIINLN